jgi:hypothetical protein
VQDCDVAAAVVAKKGLKLLDIKEIALQQIVCCQVQQMLSAPWP